MPQNIQGRQHFEEMPFPQIILHDIQDAMTAEKFLKPLMEVEIGLKIVLRIAAGQACPVLPVMIRGKFVDTDASAMVRVIQHHQGIAPPVQSPYPNLHVLGIALRLQKLIQGTETRPKRPGVRPRHGIIPGKFLQGQNHGRVQFPQNPGDPVSAAGRLVIVHRPGQREVQIVFLREGHQALQIVQIPPVVGVQISEVFPGSLPAHGAVKQIGDGTVDVDIDRDNPLVPLRVAPDDFPGVVGAAVVNQNPLKIRIGLVQHAFHALRQILPRVVRLGIDGHLRHGLTSHPPGASGSP